MLKFLTNIYDPKQLDAPLTISTMPNETSQEAWGRQEEWLKDKFISTPNPTETYTIGQLKAMHMVGVYVKE